jgi:membrane-associated HD superfamily phosphohydrolase
MQEGKLVINLQVEMLKLVIRVFFIISTIITATGFVLFISVLKRKKYSNMTVRESPLLKYLKIITAGFTVMVICNLLTIVIGY